MGNVLLTSAEAADQLGLTSSSFHRRVEAGDITPAQKLPGLRGAMLFNPDDVDALAETIKATS